MAGRRGLLTLAAVVARRNVIRVGRPTPRRPKRSASLPLSKVAAVVRNAIDYAAGTKDTGDGHVSARRQDG